MTPCPKCAYVRKSTDTNPDWQCPSCSIAYNKFIDGVQAARTPSRAISKPDRLEFFASLFSLRRIVIAAVAIAILRMLFGGGMPWPHRNRSATPEFVEGVQIVEPVVRTFDVAGASPSELDAAMLRSGPVDSTTGQRHWGFCRWNLEWKFAHASDKGQCRIDKVGITVRGVIDLPVLTNRSSSSEALKTKWDEFIKALRTHESGHWKNGITAAKDLEKRLREIPPQQNCDALNMEISAIGSQLMTEYNEIDKEYDRATRHGINQGATIW
ncbi:MAG TPA: DUF922 domain-containing protein [Paucimonas sp.]|nr:DUF922 domain-containing protein [Paucimonas sp.]